MSHLQGRYINLSTSTDRRRKTEESLKSLGIHDYYSRYEAIQGNNDDAKRIGLSAGELGLWLSWLDLLQEEIKNENNYEYLHIIEDDVIISQAFAKLIRNHIQINTNFDILMTDMYVNPSIYLGIKEEYKSKAKQGTIEIKKDFYSGCTASCIIKRENLEKVRNKLLAKFKCGKRTIPIDNTLHSLRTDKELLISTTIPFLTGIRLEDITDSTIQKSDQAKEVMISRNVCNLLRRELSLIKSPANKDELMFSYINQLKSMNEPQKESRPIADDDMTDLLTRFAHNKGLLKYEYRKGLIGEPGNKQK